jgi:hypothetical protein
LAGVSITLGSTQLTVTPSCFTSSAAAPTSASSPAFDAA